MLSFTNKKLKKLRVQISNLQNNNRQMMGESLGSMNAKELKNLESKLEKGISRIRSKKNELLFAEIEYMQKREIDLHINNQLLRAKIAESQRRPSFDDELDCERDRNKKERRDPAVAAMAPLFPRFFV